MPPITKFAQGQAIAEKSTALYTATLVDKTGTPIPSASVSTLTVTMLDSTGTIVNNRNAQNCLNAGDGTLATTSGAFTFTIQPADTVLSGTTILQLRTMTFHVVFSGGELWHEASFYVRNMDGVS
jgi:hypothetical protein